MALQPLVSGHYYNSYRAFLGASLGPHISRSSISLLTPTNLSEKL